MPLLIDNLIKKWTKEIINDKRLEKLWDFYSVVDDGPGEVVLQIKDEWEPFFGVYEIRVSASKIEFENKGNPFSPFLSIKRSPEVLDYKNYPEIDNIEDIINKIKLFVNILPKLEEEKEEEEEEESSDGEGSDDDDN